MIWMCSDAVGSETCLWAILSYSLPVQNAARWISTNAMGFTAFSKSSCMIFFFLAEIQVSIRFARELNNSRGKQRDGKKQVLHDEKDSY